MNASLAVMGSGNEQTTFSLGRFPEDGCVLEGEIAQSRFRYSFDDVRFPIPTRSLNQSLQTEADQHHADTATTFVARVGLRFAPEETIR